MVYDAKLAFFANFSEFTRFQPHNLAKFPEGKRGEFY